MSDFIHFRSTPALDEALEAEVRRLQSEGVPRKIANKSAVARTLLLLSLGNDDKKATTEEVLKRVWSVTQSVTNQAVSRAMSMVPQLMEAELDALEGDGA